MKKNILVVGAHPDDELLGCGGTLLKHIKDKDQIYSIILGEGVTSRSSLRNISKDKNKLLNMLMKLIR